MKKYISFLIIAGLILSFSLVNQAQAHNNKGLGIQIKNSIKASLKDKGEAFKAKIDEERSAFNLTIKAEQDAFKAELQKLKEDWKQAKLKDKQDFCAKAIEITN